METRAVLIWAILSSFLEVNVGSLTNCDEARKVFQLKQIGPAKYLPETPRTGEIRAVLVCSNDFSDF